MARDLIKDFNDKIQSVGLQWEVRKVARPGQWPLFAVHDGDGLLIQTFESFTEAENALLPFVIN